VELVTRNFWWLGIIRKVKQYVKECNIYQRNKNHTKKPVEKLRPKKVLKKSWTHISVDFITKLPLAQKYNSILVVCNWFSKMVYFIITTEMLRLRSKNLG